MKLCHLLWYKKWRDITYTDTVTSYILMIINDNDVT